MRGRRKTQDDYRVGDIAERLREYGTADVTAHLGPTDAVERELVERAARLLAAMPRKQLRSKIETLVSPNDVERGRRAIDALIDVAFAIEDETGHVRRKN